MRSRSVAARGGTGPMEGSRWTRFDPPGGIQTGAFKLERSDWGDQTGAKDRHLCRLRVIERWRISEPDLPDRDGLTFWGVGDCGASPAQRELFRHPPTLLRKASTGDRRGTAMLFRVASHTSFSDSPLLAEHCGSPRSDLWRRVNRLALQESGSGGRRDVLAAASGIAGVEPRASGTGGGPQRYPWTGSFAFF